MSNKVIVVGSTTNHGGVIIEGDSRMKIEGKAVHVDAMTHFCPKCKIVTMAVASHSTIDVFGKKLVIEGDKTICGAKFISSQSLVSNK